MIEQTGAAEEQPIKTKAELFAENPDRFLDLQDVLFAVCRSSETNTLGALVRIGAKAEELGQRMTNRQVYEESLIVKTYAERKINQFIALLEKAMQERAAAGLEKVNGHGKPGGFFGKKR